MRRITHLERIVGGEKSYCYCTRQRPLSRLLFPFMKTEDKARVLITIILVYEEKTEREIPPRPHKRVNDVLQKSSSFPEIKCKRLLLRGRIESRQQRALLNQRSYDPGWLLCQPLLGVLIQPVHGDILGQREFGQHLLE